MKKIFLSLLLLTVGLLPCLKGGSAAYAIDYISEIALADGSSRENCIKQLTESGYKYVDMDLNKGAGGDYIYLGYKTSDKYTDAITNLIVSDGSTSDIIMDGCNYTMVNCLNGFNGDMNKGAGGKYLYLKYTKGGKTTTTVPAITKLDIHTKVYSGYTYANGYVNNTLTYTPMDLNKKAGGADLFLYMGKTAYTGSSDVLARDLSVEYLGAGYYKFVIPVNNRDNQNVLTSISGDLTVSDGTGSDKYFVVRGAKYYGTECMKNADQQNVDNMSILCQTTKGLVYDYRTFGLSVDNKCKIEGGDHRNHRFITILWQAPNNFDTSNNTFRLTGKMTVSSTATPTSFSATVVASHPAELDAMSAPIVVDPFLNTESGEPGWATMMVTSVNKMQSLGYIDVTEGKAVRFAIDNDATSATIDLAPDNKEHRLMVLSLIRKQEIGSDGTQDYGYTLAAIPVTQKAFHSIVKTEDQINQAGDTIFTSNKGVLDGHSYVRLWNNGPLWMVDPDKTLYTKSEITSGSWEPYGSNWRIPTEDEYKELYKNTRHSLNNPVSSESYLKFEGLEDNSINLYNWSLFKQPFYLAGDGGDKIVGIKENNPEFFPFVDNYKVHFQPVLDLSKIDANYICAPTLSWKVENPREEDLIEDDAFVVERAFKRDFSDASIVGSVQFEDSLKMQDERFAHYTFTDTDDGARNNPKNLAEANVFSLWENIDANAKEKLTELYYPAHFTYYRVRRCIVKSMWENNHDYDVSWRVLNDNVMPAVTKVELAKAANWDSERMVSLSVRLANPYPWEIVNPIDSAAVHKEAIRQGMNRRLYRWNPNARIRIERYSAAKDHYNGVDEVAKVFYISGSDVSFNEKTGEYEAMLEDVLGAPYTHYYYKAIVDTTNVGWPVCANNKYVGTEHNEWTRFEDIAPVSNLAATCGTVQGQVSLTWNPSDEGNRAYSIDYREYGKGGAWLPLDSISETNYNDKKFAKAGKVYEYRVTANATYRGKTYHSASVTTVGYNPYYGTIAGKVKLSNGTAMPGNDLSIVISRSTPFSVDAVKNTETGDTIMPELHDVSFRKEIKVESDGTFSCDCVPYLSDSVTKYEVSVHGLNDVSFINAIGNTGAIKVDMADESFAHNAIDFTCNKVLTFAGNVLYNGSTVPVRDVRFSVNGVIMKDANGTDIVTDSEGRFSFVIPKGMPISLKTIKEGHTFVDDGYIVGSASNKVTPTDGMAGKVFYDLTTVRLVGRLIGGELQAQAPLGMAISHNNLGDNLRMELQLEGDNTANIVYDLKQPEKDTRDTTFTQRVMITGTPVDTIATAVSFQRKRILISPDVKTGEFCIDLFPTKYKITSISAKGHSTLTNEGEGFEILDLSRCIDTISVDNAKYLISQAKQGIKLSDSRERSTQYQATYQRVYHVPATVSVEQYDKTGMVQQYCGEKTLKDRNLQGERMDVQVASVKDGKPQYAFGYPVFSDQTNYRFRVTAHEDYYYNNDKTQTPEVVHLTGGKLTMYNGLESAASKVEAQLNSKGQADVVLYVDNPCFNLVDTAALRTVNAEVRFNGYYYKAEAIRGFIVGQQDAGTEVMPLDNTINVVDVVRDPYGTNSYAWRDAGTEYHWDRSSASIETYNFQIDVGIGGGGTWYIGLGMAEKASFTLMAGGNVNIPMRKNFESSYGDYTMTLNERIQTSDDPTMVGAMADVYVGYTDMAHLREVTAMTLADSAGYARMQAAIKAGAVRVVRQGKDVNGKDCWLVVGKKLVVANDSVESTFAYSQKHIIGTVIPQLEKRYSELVMDCSKSEAEALAKSINKPCYYKDVDGNPAMAVPSKDYKGVNEAQKIRKTIRQWREIIEENERKKYAYANNKSSVYKRYTVSEQPLEYSESVSGYKTGYDYHTFGGKVTGGFSFGGNGKDNDSTAVDKKSNGDKVKTTETYVAGLSWSFKLNPLATTFSNNISQVAYKKTMKGCGFKLDMRNNGYMDMDVYKEPGTMILSKSDWDWLTENMDSDVTGTKDTTVVNTGEYIFVLRGGAQRSPWFDADTSCVYTMGGKHVALGERTKKIDNPKIYIDNPVVSNVKRDGKAIYSVRLTNETEYNGDVAYLTPIPLILRLADGTNQHGAKITMDGAPITDGRKFDLAPGQSITKTIEVARGDGYDFEDLGLVFRDESYTLIDTAKISVHYTPESCPVTLVMPKDKWVMNTLSDRDAKSGRYYIPVEISGFDINYDGFDHIELQYKKQTEGESQWVNLCSFYSNKDLYEKASGVKQLLSTNTISDYAFYGEKDTIEMKYDLRAVSFCRLGTGFVSRASNIASGIKDTRTPCVFGKPTPVNGILTYGDVITVPFNEPIAYNYLDRVANFSVRGFTNNSDANHSARLRFNDGFAETKVERSFKDTDFTIEMNAQVDKGEDALLFFLTQQNREFEDLLAFAYDDSAGALVGFANGKIYTSFPLSNYKLNIHDLMTHVGMIYSTDNQKLWFIGGNDTISVASVSEYESGMESASPSQKISGTLAFGAFMNGYLSDVRIWHKALNSYEVANKFGKKLSAGEKDLMAWWPMDEACGNLVADRANGADLELHNVSWETPKGFSAKLDGKPLQISKNVKLFQTAENQDYTLAFWFKVDSVETAAVAEGELVELFAAGSDSLSNKGEGKVRIGFDTNNRLVMRTEGNEMDFGIDNDYVKAGQWHYLTLVANHSENIASLYIDGNMVNETTADRLGYISGTPVSFGGEGYHGYVDEISMWHLALPQIYINDIKTTALTGKEKELNAYISFEIDELQGDNLMKTVFSPLNQTVSAATGNIVGELMFDPATVGHEEATHAPMKKDVGIANIDFTWTCTDNALQINLQAKDALINNQRIDLVLRGVEDLQGNPMSNPLMWSVYVNKNVMKWMDKTIERNIRYGDGATIEAQWDNISGRTVNYTVDTSSRWLTLDRTKGLAAPLETSAITMKISSGLAPGNYNAIINLTDEDGLTSKLIVVANVVADEPDWAVTSSQEYQETMSVTGQVMIDHTEAKVVDTDEGDVVAAFYDGVCLGKANITFRGENSAYVYLNVLGKKDIRNKEILFYLWDSSRGEIKRLKLNDGTKITFSPDSIVGSHSKPVVFVCDNVGIQTVELKQGWNWVSFNLKSAQTRGVKNLFMDNSVFSNGDIIKGSLTNAKSAEYVAEYSSWTSGADAMAISIDNVYQIYVNKPTTVMFEGYEINEQGKKVTLKAGSWSQLPYLLKVPQPVNIAMSDYHIGDKALPGTIIKSHDEFAIADASGVWYGSLQYMRPGEGYFVNNLGRACTVRFTNNSILNGDEPSNGVTRAAAGNSIANEYVDAMPVIATFDADDMMEGDVLVAYCNGMEVGRAEASAVKRDEGIRKVYFLMVNANDGSAIQFAKERNGETVAVTERAIEFEATGIVGTLDEPYVIDFSRMQNADIYDINGRKYAKPSQIRTGGVYIINGEKRVVK